MSFLDELGEALRELEGQGLARELEPLVERDGPYLGLADGRRLLDFSSNDSLGLSQDPRLVAAATEALRRWGVGAGASRLITGTTEAHEALEAELATFKGAEAALVFNSGYHANAGILPALVGPGDLVVSDALNHASLIDGIRLSRAAVAVVPHADPDAVEKALRAPARRKLVVTDGVFSMDGDVAPLVALREICDRHGAWLYVDEAHATGVLGPTGAGACEAAGIVADVQMGTLGKALGTFGAYVVGPAVLRRWLVQRARSFVFTTALPPAICAAALEALRIVREEPERRRRLLAKARRFAAGLAELGYGEGEATSHIVPVVVGDAEKALRLSRRLADAGFLLKAIRPPTVPEGTSRLRVSLRADHEDRHVDALLEALKEKPWE